MRKINPIPALMLNSCYFYTMKTWLPLLISIMLFAATGCKQERNGVEAPSVTVSEPLAGRTFNFSDTISVKADISHQQSISSIQVAMINEFSTPVLPVQTFYPAANHFSLVTFMVIDDRFLESGSYSIRIKTMVDGEVFNRWVKINYNSEPLNLESLLVLTRSQGSVYRLLNVLPGDIVQERFSFSGDYKGSALISGYRLFFSAGSVMNNLTAWNLENNAVSWSVPSVPDPPLPYFNAIYCDGNEVYVSTRDALVKGYNRSGGNTFRSVQFPNGYFTSLLRHKTWLMAVFEPFNSEFNKLLAFNYPGGTVFRSIPFKGTVAGMTDFGEDGVLLFMNGEAGSAVYQYSFDLNTLINLKDFPQGNILDLTAPDTDNAFIAFADGIYWYRPDIASVVKVLPDQSVADLVFDALSGSLFVASGKTVSRYKVPSFVPEESYTMTDSITDIHLLYNK